MKNILLIMPYGSVGGMERLALNFYSKYKEQGYNVKAIKIIQLQTDIVKFGDDEIGFSNVDFFQMSVYERFFFYFKIPFLIRKIIKQNNITHCISFGDMCNVFSSLTFTNEKKIASIHALKSVEFVAKSFFNTLFKLAYKTTYRFFDKVVCISNAIKIDLLENCGYKFKNNLQVIYNPHDIAKIEEMSQDHLDDNFEKQLFESRIVLFLGRLSVQKAPWHLVKSFSISLETNPDIKLVIIGDGDNNVMDCLKKTIVELSIEDKVFLLGRKENPYKYLKKSKVLALSSYYEGTPNVIVEAIACGVPIVSSNCTDGINELMSLNKEISIGEFTETESGIITPNFFKGNLDIPSNNDFTFEEKAFSTALNKVLHDDSFENSVYVNRKALLDKFDLNKVSNEYLREIRNI